MKRYLEKVVYWTNRIKCDQEQLCVGDIEEFNVSGQADDNMEGILYITDNEEALRILKDRHLPVAVWLHEDNRDQDLSRAAYAVESPEELDAAFFEKIYRREKEIPWEILETDRCLVREMIPEDGTAFAEIYKDAAINKYMKDFHENEAGETEYIKEYRQQYRFFEYGVWSVLLKDTGEVIGRVGFSEAAGEIQFGYMIGVPWQRQGLAYEVCKAVLAYAEEELEFEKILLWTEESNAASRKLCSKLGFSEKKAGCRRGMCCYEYIYTRQTF